jgi:hypothetical protein
MTSGNQTTKSEYIKAHPRTILASRLEAETGWPNDTEIEIVGGLDAPQNKCSNLYKALERSNLGEYVIGARRQYESQGYWMAVA